jgi:hypothetical protein
LPIAQMTPTVIKDIAIMAIILLSNWRDMTGNHLNFYTPQKIYYRSIIIIRHYQMQLIPTATFLNQRKVISIDFEVCQVNQQLLMLISVLLVWLKICLYCS